MAGWIDVVLAGVPTADVAVRVDMDVLDDGAGYRCVRASYPDTISRSSPVIAVCRCR